MERVQEIKSAREQRFYDNRMKGKGAKEKTEALKDLKTGIDLIISPVVRNDQEQIKQTVGVQSTEKTSNTEASSEKKTKPKKKTKKKAAVAMAD